MFQETKQQIIEKKWINCLENWLINSIQLTKIIIETNSSFYRKRMDEYEYKIFLLNDLLYLNFNESI